MGLKAEVYLLGKKFLGCIDYFRYFFIAALAKIKFGSKKIFDFLILSNDLKVIDAAAVSLARENNIPIIISSIFENGNLLKICKGNKGIFTIVN